jgi:hypothetical protein
MLKTYYLISPDLKIVLTTLHKGEGGKNHCYRRERANKLLVSTIFARDCRSDLGRPFLPTSILTVFEGCKMDADKGKRSLRAEKFARGKPA